MAYFTVSCKSNCDEIDEIDEITEGGQMIWITSAQMETMEIMDNQDHYIYFPPKDCEYEFICKNYTNLKLKPVDMIGLPLCRWEGDNPEYMRTDNSVKTPYYTIKVEGNRFYVSLKGSTIPCGMVWGIERDAEHYDTFYFYPESELI